MLLALSNILTVSEGSEQERFGRKDGREGFNLSLDEERRRSCRVPEG